MTIRKLSCNTTEATPDGAAMEQAHDPFDESIAVCMKTTLHTSDIINKKMEEAYQEVRTMKKPEQKTLKKYPVVAKCGAAAAILVLSMTYCVQNPASAAQIPLIGHIFSRLEQQVSYPGNYSDSSVKLPVTTDSDGKNDNRTENDARPADGAASGKTSPDKEGFYQTEGSYQVTSGGLTVSLNEVTCDSNAVYLGIHVKNKKKFDRRAQSDSTLTFVCRADLHRADGTTDTFSLENGNPLALEAEGTFQDNHTFEGIARFSVPDLRLSDYTSCDLAFTEFSQELTTGQEMSGTLPDSNETVTWTEYDWNRRTGTWNFHLDLADIQKETAARTSETTVHEINEQGFGIEKIVKTGFELYAVPVLPEGASPADYVVSILDADGKQLDSHGSSLDQKSIYQRDISKITIYILKWDDYMECKGTNSAKQPEKAVFQTTISLL